MYNFDRGEWELKPNALFKLLNVDGILAYILPHVNDLFQQIGFTYLFWIYKWENKKRVALYHDWSSEWFKNFDITEQTMYDHILEYLEDK